MKSYKIIRSIINSHIQKKHAKLDIKELAQVVIQVNEILSHENLLLELTGSYQIVGDIHGNIDILLRIFTKFGYPDQTKYVLMGDYVDRGTNSIEVISFLFSLKVCFPENLILLRGNHESRSMTSIYGFKDECIDRADLYFYNSVMNVFDNLPICATINGVVFVVHGGIPSSAKSLAEIRKLEKNDGEPLDDDISDMLWSDPSFGTDYFEASERGAGHKFGPRAASEFLRGIGCSLIVRSHEECQTGYSFPFGDDQSVITIFSSPDYCGNTNAGATLRISADESGQANITQFCPRTRLANKPVFTLPKFILDEECLGVAELQEASDPEALKPRENENLLQLIVC